MTGALTFQFQTGAIKSQPHFGVERLSPVGFQFQTGAIKRCADSAVLRERTLFQFQTGAIKRCGGQFRSSR